MQDFDLITVFITGVIGIVVVIVFFVMASNIGKMKIKLDAFLDAFRDNVGMERICSYCGFKSNQQIDFCPVCEKNENGKTLSELKSIYEHTENMKSKNPDLQHL